MCVYMEERSFVFLVCFKFFFCLLLTLPDPPRINVDGMICNRCM